MWGHTLGRGRYRLLWANQPTATALDASSCEHPLAGPLYQLAVEKGTQQLRRIVLGVGAPTPRDNDELVAGLVGRADEDPDALAAIRSAVSRPSQG
jgi:hypothetical protein